ncbi:MAG: hypothetical protein HYY45_01015 [Deltaproteobacteria bacterium]|nr:hypothetical protein [Deltaproteobacteria bacterium]
MALDSRSAFNRFIASARGIFEKEKETEKRWQAIAQLPSGPLRSRRQKILAGVRARSDTI